MRLYYASGASSLAPHILLEESGLAYVTEKVNLDNKTSANGDYTLVNPKSYVPALETDDGQILTECSVILEYIAIHSLKDGLIGRYNEKIYWDQRMWLNYIATELHKNFISPFRKGNWLPNTSDSKKFVFNRIYPRLKLIDNHLKNTNWLVENKFSLADPYLFVMTNWMRRLNYEFLDFPNLEKFDNRMRSRPTVKSILTFEGKPHSLTEWQ